MDQQKLLASEVKMAASTTFDFILEQIKTSNLNFWVQLSPFSATISLKKSLVKDVSGIPLMPPILTPVIKPDPEGQTKKISKLECALENMKMKLADAIDDCAEAHKTISILEKELAQSKSAQHETKSIVKNQSVQSQKFETLQRSFDKLADDKHEVLLELESERKKSKLINNKLNRDISELNVKHQKEKTEITKNLKSEIKSWRKDLGSERKEKLKLEKQLEMLQKKVEEKLHKSTQACQISSLVKEPTLPNDSEGIDCTVCAEPILNYEPEYFNAIEMNPACDNCKTPSIEHSSSLKNSATGQLLMMALKETRMKKLIKLREEFAPRSKQN